MSSIFKKVLGIAVVGVALTGTSGFAQNVNVDIKNPSELTGYRTYQIDKLHATDSMIEPRMLAAITHEFELKGWHEVARNGDVIVTAVLAGNDDPQQYSLFYGNLNSVQYDVPSTALPAENVEQTPAGTLILDMYDSHTGQLIWRSTATDFLSNDSGRNQLKVDATINKMFDSLPWDDTPFR